MVKVEEYLTDVFAEKAVDFIDRHADAPFFLMLTPNAPHTPIQATDEYYDRFPSIEAEGQRIFAAMVMSIIPAHLMRSVAGAFDNESVAVTAMVETLGSFIGPVRGEP